MKIPGCILVFLVALLGLFVLFPGHVA